MNTVKRFTLLILLLTFIASPVLEAYYDPHIGRFTQRDPVGEGVNHYVYTANNPMKFVDPTGTRIVILGSAGKEVTMDSSGLHFHTGGAGLSTEASMLYTGITGMRTIEAEDGSVTKNPDLRDTTAVGKTVMDVIRSDKTVYLHFDSSLPDAILGVTEFLNTASNDNISIRINAKNATGTFGGYLRSRKTIIHELVHANQAITDPSTFRNRSYYNVYDLEYQAYDIGARFAAEVGGHNATVLGYVPPSYLLSKQFNPNSLTYHYYISMAARETASPFR